LFVLVDCDRFRAVTATRTYSRGWLIHQPRVGRCSWRKLAYSNSNNCSPPSSHHLSQPQTASMGDLACRDARNLCVTFTTAYDRSEVTNTIPHGWHENTFQLPRNTHHHISEVLHKKKRISLHVMPVISIPFSTNNTNGSKRHRRFQQNLHIDT
jgi:hypothetical protein